MSGLSVQHTFTRPGRYQVQARLVKNRNLFEYRSAVVVSANHSVVSPLILTPVFSASTVGEDGTVAVPRSPPDSSDVSLACSVRALPRPRKSRSASLMSPP